MKKKIISIIIAALCMCLLAGCQCEHSWIEATCTAPRTCSECGETEGEPIGHSWTEVSCAAPRTCASCALTEGESLPHTWVEANYQDPKTCSVCSATEGEPLEADFEKYGLTINMYENKHYDYKTGDGSRYSSTDPFRYVTSRSDDKSKKVEAETYICDYRIFEGDETHLPKEGYEWKAFDLEMTYYEKDDSAFALEFGFWFENYYAIDEWDASEFELTGTDWEYLGEKSFGKLINYHGEEYPCAITLENGRFGDGYWTHYVFNTELEEPVFCIDLTVSLYACVPVGYDGVVIGLVDMIHYGQEKHIYEIADENTLLMRMGNTLTDWG